MLSTLQMASISSQSPRLNSLSYTTSAAGTFTGGMYDVRIQLHIILLALCLASRGSYFSVDVPREKSSVMSQREGGGSRMESQLCRLHSPRMTGMTPRSCYHVEGTPVSTFSIYFSSPRAPLKLWDNVQQGVKM